jgi:hypothetical protein
MRKAFAVVLLLAIIATGYGIVPHYAQTVMSTATTTVTATFTSTTSTQPPQPESGYVWSTSGDTFQYFQFDGEAYPTYLTVGTYLPQTILPDQKFALYTYVTRTIDPVPVFPFYEQSFVASFCIGGYFTFFPFDSGIHFSIGWSGTFDRWVRHIGAGGIQFSKDLSFSATFPEISYPNFASIPYGAWDGPYVAYVTMKTGYVIPEVPLGLASASLVIAMVVTLLLFRRIGYRPQGSGHKHMSIG